MNLKITLLPGDGIGPEVTEAAVKVLKYVAEKFDITLNLNSKDFGGVSIDNYGIPLTEETLQACYESNAIFLGAVGGYQWEDLEHNKKPEAGLLKIRKDLGLFANIRPAKVYSSFLDASSLKNDVLDGTDFIVLRELTGGIYFGEPRGYDKTKGWNTMVYSENEVERIVHMAFKMAKDRNKKVTSVDKANVLEVSQFWRNIVKQVHKNYPDIQLQNMYVDNAAMQIVRDPRQFDVIVTSNLFGDILSDIAGMITGSLGMLPSASLGEKHALYEPVHGSAPDIAGQNTANPIAAIASVAMMLNHTFQLTKAAEILDEAIERTLKQGFRTTDIFTKPNKLVTTTKMTDVIIENFEEIYNEQAIRVFTL
jgi:3-isopropylmalate dehydrogenase